MSFASLGRSPSHKLVYRVPELEPQDRRLLAFHDILQSSTIMPTSINEEELRKLFLHVSYRTQCVNAKPRSARKGEDNRTALRRRNAQDISHVVSELPCVGIDHQVRESRASLQDLPDNDFAEGLCVMAELEVRDAGR